MLLLYRHRSRTDGILAKLQFKGVSTLQDHEVFYPDTDQSPILMARLESAI